MKAPPLPTNEQARLRKLDQYDILDTAPEPAFDSITAIAAHIAGVPIALVSLVDGKRQWFKSHHGLDADQTPREVSFCGHVVASGEALTVADALEDPRFSDNPLVTGAPNVRFYAGVPLQTPDGFVLGTLCAIDHSPRLLSAKQIQMLELLAQQVVDQLEMRRRDRTHVALRIELQKYKTFFELNPALFATANRELYFVDLNPAWESVVGWSLDELRAKPSLEFIHPEDLPAVMKEAGRVLSEPNAIVDFEYRLQHKDGHWVNLAWVAAMVGDVIFCSARDMTEYRRVQFALRQALDRASDLGSRLSGIMASANYSVIETDTSGIIREYNKSAERMLGHAAEDVIGKTSPAIFHDLAEVVGRAKQLSAELGTVIEPGFEAFVAKARLGEADEREWTYIRKDGTRFPVQLSITRRLDSQGEIVGFMGIASDITERKRMQQLQSEFVSTVSHELRTPLTSIRGSLGLVAAGVTGELPEEAKEYIDIALSNSDRLVRLINDILDIEKMQSGSMEFRFQTIELAASIKNAIAVNAAYASNHQVNIVLVDDVPAGEVLVDPDRLTQVLTNLLSNAAKFSPANSNVELGVKLVGERFRITVRDHGPGISDEFRSRIFQRFAQADASSTRKSGGTGLGLSISKAIVEKMRGRIGFEPAADGGTIFFFELPFLAPVVREPASSSRALQVLVCEDDPDVSSLLKRLLISHGYDVKQAPTLERARRLLAAHHFDAVTLDLVLADGDGSTLLAEMRESERHRLTPVVVISGASGQLASAAVMVADVIQKPFDEHRLLSVLQNALRNCERQPPRILHVEDEENIRRIVRRTLSQSWEVVSVESIHSAKLALEAQAFDVVLLDLTLPDGFGEELIGLVGRAQVILFTATDPSLALSRRVDAALIKSKSNPTDVRDTILSLLAKTRSGSLAT
jgi:PAS domain S-box-containing protein